MSTPARARDLPIILLSHRGPVTFTTGTDGTVRGGRGGGGLVTALGSLAVRQAGCTWICAAASDADRAHASGHASEVGLRRDGTLCPDGESPAGQVLVRMIDIPASQHNLFYSVACNPILWFIQHGLYGFGDAPTFTRTHRQAFVDGYLAANEAFAAAVIEEVERAGGRALVMLHDYHFYLVAEMIRRACPQAIISHFTHIPWPGPGEWSALPSPVREKLLRGLLGADVVAFHTRRFARNFLLCCQELLGLPIDLDRLTVEYEGRDVRVRFYPISIDVAPLRALAESAAVAERIEQLQSDFLGERQRLILRVDRTDPSKNIVRGFRAFDLFLAEHPEYHGAVTFFAMLQPSRQDIPEYADYIAAIGGIVAEINARYGRDGWQPVRLWLESDMNLAVAAYTQCDVLMVNAVRDGMNLVAKEAVTVNRRNMVLLLSDATGAHEELGPYSLTVHPFDIAGQADAIAQALVMPAAEAGERLAAARAAVADNDISAWFTAQLSDLDALLAPPASKARFWPIQRGRSERVRSGR